MSDKNELAPYLFHQGTNFHAYQYLGANRVVRRGAGYTYSFRAWAPNASEVYLLSDLYGWDNPVKMQKISEGGIWELIVNSPTSLEKTAYKFKIVSAGGTVNKGDPYARFSRGKDDGASLVFTKSTHKWQDGNWLKHRKKTVCSSSSSYLPFPINIYELHLGSFIRHEDGSYYSYRELAEILPSYVKSMGYTHVELLPIQEHPFDGSWGYQPCAFFAPTSRFGDPDDFRYLVDKLHTNGVGVILDWVCAHFPKDEWGLYEFDGKPLYEYQGEDRKESASWGTRFFDLGREEVQSFLISNALYYFREFHIDGLRVDAVASMIYLDYDKADGEWVPNYKGTNENLEATAFIKKLNSRVHEEFPDVLMIAEESTSFSGITKPTYEGGLGFNLKWNMGFANDLYDYLATDPVYRKHKHKALNFPIMYAFSENYCLPISHDEVVHGKKSFVDKPYGSYEDKFSQARCALLLMMSYPGKKLTFMGTEYAPFREWAYEESLEWFMLNYPKHSEFRDFVRSLNNFYLSREELWHSDFDGAGFSWILPDEADKNLVAYKRYSSDGGSIICVISFSGAREDIRIDLPEEDSSDVITLFETSPTSVTVKTKLTEEEHYADLALSPFSGIVFEVKSKNIKIKIQGENHVL